MVIIAALMLLAIDYTTAEMHRAIYDISRLTAYKDLKSLETMGLLQSVKVGNQKRYSLAQEYKNI